MRRLTSTLQTTSTIILCLFSKHPTKATNDTQRQRGRHHPSDDEGLTIHDVHGILAMETKNEPYRFDELDVDDDLSLAKNDTYLVCCQWTTTSNDDGSATTRSGYACRSRLASALHNYATDAATTTTTTNDQLTCVSNTPDKSCFFSHATAGAADYLTEKGFAVRLVTPAMKLGQGITEISTGPNPPSLYEVFLAPGVSRSREDAEVLGSDIVEAMRAPTSSSTRRRLTGTDSDDDDCVDVFSSLTAAPSTAKGQSIIFTFPPPTSSVNVSDCRLLFLSRVTLWNEIAQVGFRSSSYEVMNEQAQWITQSEVPDERPWFDVGLEGQGQVVAVSDTGLDVGSCYFLDGTGDLVRDGSVNSTQRKVVQYVPFADNVDSLNGHGTHVVGTVCGRQADERNNEATGDADGIARKAKVSFFDVGFDGNDTLKIPTDPNTLFGPGKEAGAHIHSISWGTLLKTYGPMEHTLDDYIYDDETFLVVAAAGNYGNIHGDNSYDTISSPAISKNVLSVGVSQSDGPDISPGMKGMNYMSGFSSRGPTHDGRRKPDVIAPGEFILSVSAVPNRRGSCDKDDALRFETGSSMSAAVASGTAALARQYFESDKFTSRPINPTATLIKAVLINGAQDLLGVQYTKHIFNVTSYDNNQGFGRLSLIHSLALDNVNHLHFIAKDRRTVNDQGSDKITLYWHGENDNTMCNATHFSATLTWTDPPAVPYCKHCVLNDLDLIVKRNGHKLYPNGLQERDVTNNVERVRVAAKYGDKFVVKVQATNLVTENQTYALAITGCFRKNGNVEDPTIYENTSESTLRLSL